MKIRKILTTVCVGFCGVMLFALSIVGQGMTVPRPVVAFYEEIESYASEQRNMLASKGKRYDAAAREDIADGKKALAKKSAAEIAARSDLKEKDFYFLGRIYAAADNDAKVLESMQKFLAQFPSDAYPTTMLLDRNGVVRYIGIGSGTEESENLEDMIKKVISEDGRLAAPQK